MNTAEHLSDAISAASLVLAVLAALYTLWLPSVTAALEIEPKPDAEDREPQRKQVMDALVYKSAPLCVATAASAIILLPRSKAIVIEIWEHHAVWTYDDVKAFFLLTLSLMLVLALVSLAQLIRLIAKRIELG